MLRLKTATGRADHTDVAMSTAAPVDGRDDDGLSLVEVMVALAVFVVGSLSLLSVLTGTLSGTYDNRARVTAANLAAEDIDEARGTEYYALGGTDVTRSVDGRPYRVVRTVTTTMASGTTSSCIGNTGSARQSYKRVSTRVEPAFRGRAKPVQADTLVKAPVFDPNSARGAIAVLVIDRTGAPITGVPVSIGATNLTTDLKGCSSFDGLVPGTHVMTATKANHVKIDGDPVLSKSVRVTAGQITAEALRIDVAANITVRTDVYNGTTPVPGHELSSGLAVRLAAPDRATATRFESAGKPVTAGVDLTWTAFPSPGGYDAYLGPCTPVVHTDSEPGTSPPRIDLSLSPITIQLTGGQADSVKAAGKTLTATYVPSAAEPCAEQEQVTFATKTKTGCQANSNGTDGCWFSVALRRGDWTLTLDGGKYPTGVTVQARTPLSTKISVTGNG